MLVSCGRIFFIWLAVYFLTFECVSAKEELVSLLFGISYTIFIALFSNLIFMLQTLQSVSMSTVLFLHKEIEFIKYRGCVCIFADNTQTQGRYLCLSLYLKLPWQTTSDICPWFSSSFVTFHFAMSFLSSLVWKREREREKMEQVKIKWMEKVSFHNSFQEKKPNIDIMFVLCIVLCLPRVRFAVAQLINGALRGGEHQRPFHHFV